MTSIETDINVHLKAVTDAEIRADWLAYRAAVEAALEIDPKNPAALLSRGLLRLRFDEPGGWEDHEFRQPRLDLCEDLDEWPEWKGESLEGKHILIAGEQGLGDQIMFARYIPKVLGMNPRRVTLHVRPELARLFVDLCEDYPALSVVTDDRDIASNDLDCWIAIASLPLHFGIIEPYPLALAKPPVEIPENGRVKVGLCWSANPKHQRDAHRSVTFPDIETILNASGCDFYAFQFGPAAAQNDGRATDVARFCHDFADTGALLQELDVLVSVDTAIVHLAGTIGVPVVILQPTSYRDWRWEIPGKWYQGIGAKSIEGAAFVLEAMAASYSKSQALAVNEPPLVSTTETRYGPMQYFARDKYVGRSLELYGEWSEGEVDLFRAFIKPGDVVVEAGSNIGAHTRPLMAIVGPAGKVISYEPSGRNGSLLSKNTFWSRPIEERKIVSYSRMALSDRYGVYGTDFSPDNPGGCEFSYLRESLDPESDDYDWSAEDNPDEANAAPLDLRIYEFEHLGRCDFLKADVEGMEIRVLRGAEKVVERFRPVIYVENDRPENTEALCSWLHEHKYRLYMHCPRLFNPNNWKGNKINVFGDLISSMILAIPREKFIPFDMASLGLARVKVKR